ncbi:MAG: hypothetical protein RLZZ200_1806 [Pseudomonadota bacterium]|jgi:lactoylglutathione lyase
MRIEHVAIWTDDIEGLAHFYSRYFGAVACAPYRNEAKGFESRFLSFESGARIELMRTTRLAPARVDPGTERMGLTHLALSVGSMERVDALVEQLKSEGVPVIDGPRRTGDGYYEAVILDPDGNRIEVTA